MSHKAQENKSFHRGAYIGYCVLPDGRRFTTNGSLMVEGEIDTKPVKGQQDLRNQEMKPIQPSQLVKVVGKMMEVFSVEDYDDETEIVRTSSHTIAIDKGYSTYLQAKYPAMKWLASDVTLVVVDDELTLLAILAAKKLPEDYKESTNA